jgi:NTP pyrophosphatase (non-canonical NTP hydrolase)
MKRRRHKIMTNTQLQFIESFNALATEAHDTAVSKGWWSNEDAELLAVISTCARMSPKDSDALIEIASKISNKNDGEMIALMHSELSEALEALRHGNPPDDKVPEFSGVEAELADVIIRIFDLASQRGWRVAEALVAKMEMNKGRSVKHGGKLF